MLWKTMTLLVLAACAAPPNPLLEALNRPTVLRSINLEIGPRPEPAEDGFVLAVAEPIYEVTVHPSGSTLPPAMIHLLPRRDDVLNSGVLRIHFDAGEFHRNAWLVASPSLLPEPVNWGTFDEPVMQLIPFDVILPFPALRITDYGGKRWHRQPTSALVELHDDIRLFSPIYLQLIVEVPEANELGFLGGDVYGLIPGG
jgi:hypothetical protein